MVEQPILRHRKVVKLHLMELERRLNMGSQGFKVVLGTSSAFRPRYICERGLVGMKEDRCLF